MGASPFFEGVVEGLFTIVPYLVWFRFCLFSFTIYIFISKLQCLQKVEFCEPTYSADSEAKICFSRAGFKSDNESIFRTFYLMSGHIRMLQIWSYQFLNFPNGNTPTKRCLFAGNVLHRFLKHTNHSNTLVNRSVPKLLKGTSSVAGDYTIFDGGSGTSTLHDTLMSTLIRPTSFTKRTAFLPFVSQRCSLLLIDKNNTTSGAGRFLTEHITEFLQSP